MSTIKKCFLLTVISRLFSKLVIVIPDIKEQSKKKTGILENVLVEYSQYVTNKSRDMSPPLHT